jgi:hypothetical protein
MVVLIGLEGVTQISNLDFCCYEILQYYCTHYPILSRNHKSRYLRGDVSSFASFLGLFYSLFEFRETVNYQREGVGTFFLAIAVAFLSYGCLSAETLLKSSIFLALMALTSIVGRVRAPILLAQRAAFLDSHLFGDSNLVGTSTLVLTRVVALSGGFLGSLAAFSLAWEFATNCSMFSRMDNFSPEVKCF